jgi:protein-S-isoprenylcysteine O-methyltransferase Ste14
MSTDFAHKSYWETADVVFGIPLLIGIALQFIIPFSLPREALRQVSIPVGIILIAVGLVFIVLARREFARYSQPTDPGKATGKVVTTGVFSRSRNPLYLGVVGLVAGAALAFNSLWILVSLVPAIVACHYVLIAPEERYLTAKFGQEYLTYMASVRRWFGRGRSNT